SNNATLSYNDIYNNEKGVQLLYSENSTISNNEIYENHECGVYLYYSSMNLLINNKLFDNYWQGLYLDYSNSTIISQNFIKKNYKDGIYSNNSLSGSFSSNIIMENKGFGIFIDNSTNDTTIWRNNILNNSMDEVFTASSLNNWDNGTFGNYWGDYKSKYPDAGIETIFWNMSYSIEEVGSLDNFPLVDPILPDAPTFITGNQTFTYADITIKWNRLGCAESYDFYINGELNETTSDNFQTYLFEFNGIYELQVIASNLFGKSLPSKSIIISVEVIPDIPDFFTSSQTFKKKKYDYHVVSSDEKRRLL
ncbi:MAG: right-handed parallel beta-helix repeat-containing protein, partial [Promethearchaeota archaeon]